MQPKANQLTDKVRTASRELTFADSIIHICGLRARNHSPLSAVLSLRHHGFALLLVEVCVPVANQL